MVAVLRWGRARFSKVIVVTTAILRSAPPLRPLLTRFAKLNFVLRAECWANISPTFRRNYAKTASFLSLSLSRRIKTRRFFGSLFRELTVSSRIENVTRWRTRKARFLEATSKDSEKPISFLLEKKVPFLGNIIEIVDQ